MTFQEVVVIFAVVLLLLLVMLLFKFRARQGRYVLYAVILAVMLLTYSYIKKNDLVDKYALALYVDGLDQPVQAVWVPDKSDRWFIVGRRGVIHIMVGNEVQAPPFLDIRDQVNSSGYEQGLLNLVLHPDFSQNGVFFIYYTGLDGGIILARYHTQSYHPELANPESAVELLSIPKENEFHNGGSLLFGLDGYLYVGIGDDVQFDLSAAQSLDTYLGKILRLDVSDPNVPYKIPADNPFVHNPNALPEIWAYGLRNPWRIALDVQSGDLYIADVGSQAREEVNVQRSGRGGVNYGWPWYEGSQLKKTEGISVVDSRVFVFPVAEYRHDTSGGCAIIGGYVYNGGIFPELHGKYLFSDLCYGYIWALKVTESKNGNVEVLMRDPSLHPSSFAVDGDGEIYLVDTGKGNMFKLVEMDMWLAIKSFRK